MGEHRKVRIRKDRNCFFCDTLVKGGNVMVTVSPKYEGRKWICLGCIEALDKLATEKYIADTLPFDDEGMEYLQQQNISEAEAEILERISNPKVRERLEVFLGIKY